MKSFLYITGEIPQKGDIIRCDERTLCCSAESKHNWVVISICEDMLNAKCEDAPKWRQAFFIEKMHKLKIHP